MPEIETVGLRERKRVETRAHLEKAAVEIALRDGIEHATIDAISAAANVSPRTFFNYFENKEDAILGVRDTEITPEAISAHAARYDGADLAESTLALLFSTLGPMLPDSSLQQLRMTLVKRYPHLMARQLAQLTRMSEQLIEAITVLQARDPRFAEFEPAERVAASEVVLALCGGAFRVAAKQWIASDGASDSKELESRAIRLVREVIERLK